MARNWGAMIVRELERAENQKRREELRVERELQRERVKIHNAYLREQARADKECYIESQIQQAEKMTKELLRSYEKYSTLMEAQILKKEIFNFNLLKKEYVEPVFSFSENEPIKKDPIIEVAHPTPVPNQSWLENIFSSKKEKRLSIIAQNERHTEEVRMINQQNADLVEREYHQKLSDYERRKSDAKTEWAKKQQRKKESVEMENAEMELWHNAYMSGDDDAITAYIDTLFSTYNFALNTIDEHQIGYNKYGKKLVVDLHIKDKAEIFEAEGYKYIKQRDDFEPIKMKATEFTERMRSLMIQVCIAAFHLLFRNDVAGHLDIITINIYYDHVCCISAEVDKDTFAKHNFTTKSGVAAFMELQMRACKQISRGVKPFDMLFSALE